MGCKPSSFYLFSSKKAHHSQPQAFSPKKQKPSHNRTIPKIKISKPVLISEKEISSPPTTSSQFLVSIKPPGSTNTFTTSTTSKAYFTSVNPITPTLAADNHILKPSSNPPSRPRRPPSTSPQPQPFLSLVNVLTPAPGIINPDLTTDLHLVTSSIQSLIQQVTLYKTTLLHHKTQTLSELSTLLTAIPTSTTPRLRLDGLFIDLKSKYETLQRKLAKINELVTETVVCPWREFKNLEREEQVEMAKRLRRGCELMRMFDGLTCLRSSLEAVFQDGNAVRRAFDGVFEEILCLLKLAGCEKETMRWRVLGVCMRQRGRELASMGEEIGRRREGVSKTLLGVVEGLCE